MRFNSTYALFIGLSVSVVSQAQYTDYIGAGHNSGITITASSSDDGFDPSYLMDGSGLDTTTWVHDKEADNTTWIAGAVSNLGSGMYFVSLKWSGNLNYEKNTD